MERIIHGEQARLEQGTRLSTAAGEEVLVLAEQPAFSFDRSSALAVFQPDL